MKLTLTIFVALLLYTVPTLSKLTSETDNLPRSSAGIWKEHADKLFVLGMGLLVIIAILYIMAQIVDEMNRRKLETQNQKIESQQKQIENLLWELETIKQERIVRP